MRRQMGTDALNHLWEGYSFGLPQVMRSDLVHLAASCGIGIVLAPVRWRRLCAVSKSTCRLLCKIGAVTITGVLLVALPSAAQQLTNDKLSLTVDAQAGS